MNDAVASILAAIDSGSVAPAEAEAAIRLAGGFTYILCNLALP